MKIKGISCYVHPTTIVLIDDDEDFLNALKMGIPSPCKAFQNPYAALKYLANNEHHPNFDTKNLMTDINDLYKNIYNSERFNHISLIIVDYQMPGLKGLELCKSIKNHDAKIILLTGEADTKLAIDAFNQGIIDQFIRKDTFDLQSELMRTIKELQFQYFQQASGFIIENLAHTSPSLPIFLQNDSLLGFFKDVLRKNKVAEYYLLTPQGDFLFITSAGKICYFMLRDEQTLHQLIVEVEQEYLQEPDPQKEAALDLVRCKHHVPFLYRLDYHEWHANLHPLHSEICDGKKYYYCIVEDDGQRGIAMEDVLFSKH